MKYDIAIIGSGLGGLECAYILAKEGYNVCVLEKNRVLGGCLQTFKRCGTVFDTGMHYIGGMDEGRVLNRLFNYFDLNSRLKLKRLDEDGYDIIRYDGTDYKFAMGYERFRDTMIDQFPGEAKSIDTYISMVKEIRDSVDMYNLENITTSNTAYLKYYGISIAEFLESITENKVLRNVLAGLAPLYGGMKETSPIYVPLVIHSSYIEGAYRFLGGGSQLSDCLADSVKFFGGTIIPKAEVTRIYHEGGRVTSLEINHEERIEATNYISDIHPKTLLKLLDENAFKAAYKHRIASITETYGMFTVYLAMKANAFPYRNRNYFCYQVKDLWNDFHYTEDTWPGGYMIHFSPGLENPDHTDGIIVNTIMRWEEMMPWLNTTVENRGDSYRDFKKHKSELVMNQVEKDFPGIKQAVRAIYTSSPLTYRDYTGTWEGSVYGIQKDYKNPMKTLILPRTHLRNLLLTGQNTNVHGVVGVTIGSFLTCSELLGKKYLMDKLYNEC
ncbi:MAG TPA: NAD(P)/FAD-dependent oxidoreductase [Bacteroidales bacterium]|nr:NAD(P)/FAD-dependent oxidoreductase [Bacteroidales bacterium]